MDKQLKQHLSIIILLIIVIIAGFTRLYGLGQIPAGMTWDEAAIGYNGYSITQSWRDEWLERMPVSFKSFGDFKAPLGIYTSGIITLIFGLDLWSVRLPFALAGIASILGVYLLVMLTWPKSNYRRLFATIASLAMIISPWHFHISRIGFESNLMLALVIWGLVFLLNSVRLTESKKKTYLLYISAYLTLSATAFSLSLYAYHSSKIAVPIIVLGLLLIYKKALSGNFNRLILIPIITSVLIIAPLGYDMIIGEGMTRSGVLVLADTELKTSEKINQIASNIFAHLSPDFLVMGETLNYRHGPGVWGVFLPITFIVIIVGSVAVANNLIKRKKGQFHEISYLAALVLFAGLMPAILGDLAPHQNRALISLPGFILIAVIGVNQAYSWLSSIINLSQLKFIAVAVLVIELFFFSKFINHYNENFPALAADDFQEGYLEVMEYAINYERGFDDVQPVERILFTNQYGQAYIYALFARKTNPYDYHQGSLYKYLFVDEIKPSDLDQENTLIISGPKDSLPEDKAFHIISGSDQQPRFYLYYNPPGD